MAKTQTRKHAEYKASPAHLAAFTAHVAILADTANASTTPALKALAAELHQGLTCGSLDINQLTKVFLTGVEQGGFGCQVAEAVGLLIELIFADNSRALHRGVLSALRRLHDASYKDAINQVLRARILHETAAALSAQQPHHAVPLQQQQSAQQQSAQQQ
eukprot:CAMPEP_0202370714 /NCGR_PEP_ID=MMETSP1127-20130417/2261_1 /ASSEMBLY_ACC=CAM_ASM_000462 /TAXON_ID=3047 /ORGANISM="Dunaliella tertiolecta, Strain CCMP1320" /LENGTH=159 /DNA_ID=CAMNT_0048966727 /DNA_START=45 /DNA_END=521 /DNA_ORIENTATION=-